MIYKITFKKNLHHLKALIYNVIAIGIAVYYFSISETDNRVTFTVLFTALFVLCLIASTLHINYYLKPKEVEINTVSQFISFNRRDHIYFHQIEKIILVIPPALYNNNQINVSPFDEYHYAKIVAKDGKEFFFTSLLNQNVQEVLHKIGVELIVKRRLIAYTFW